MAPHVWSRRLVRQLLVGCLVAAGCSDTELTGPAAPPADTARPSAALAAAADSATAADSTILEVDLSAASVDGTLNNGQQHTGQIVSAGETDTWTFSANQGNTLVVSVGELSGTADFAPWVRLVGPNGAVIGNDWGYLATQVQVAAPSTGTYTVIIGTYDSGYDATGSYRVMLARAPSTSQVVSPGDQGGVAGNGTVHTGSIAVGDVDQWTFDADQGDVLMVGLGETAGSANFTPWIRLVAPNGAVIGNEWGYVATQVQASAPSTGRYTVIVGTYDSGYDDTGDYRLNVVEVPGTQAISSGDQGGAMTNGAIHTGAIAVGDLDPWRFTATQGSTIIVTLGETTGTADFTPWVRLIAPNGAIVGNEWGYLATQVQIAAPSTGTYTVVVGTYDSGYDGTGGYRVSLTNVPAAEALTVSSGDHGGALTNGAVHTGSIAVGDVDAWTFDADQGDLLVIGLGETAGSADFTPWLRLVGPNGAVIGNEWGYLATQVQVAAPSTGTYTVVVGTYDSGYDGTGDYRLNIVETPEPPIVSPDDQGGAVTNGAIHTGAIVIGDVDTWQFDATQGKTIIVALAEATATADFTPWIRLVAPNGAVIGNEWGYAATQAQIAAPSTGTYTVIVGTYDSGYDATGDYRLTVATIPGALTVSPGDHGGLAGNGSVHTGNIAVGDVDGWTFDADQGDVLMIGLGETAGSPDFTPWVRLIAPNGAVIGNDWGYLATQVQVAAPSTGTYTVIVGSYDSGYDGSGDYRLNVIEVPGTQVVPSGDQGGAMSTGVNYNGSIVVGDLDPWRFTTTLGRRITLTLTELSGSSDFTPWIRLVGPTGVVVSSQWGAAGAQLVVNAPSSGTYRVIVGTYDSGYDATGSYRLRLSLTTPTGVSVDAEPDPEQRAPGAP